MRLLIVAAAAIGLILLVAFVVSRLVRSRTRGMSIRMQIFLALAVIVGAFAFGLGLMVIDRIEARAVRIATQAAEDEATAIAGVLGRELMRENFSIDVLARRLQREQPGTASLKLELLDEQRNRLFFDRNTGAPREGIVSEEAPILVDNEIVGYVRVLKPTVVIRRMLADFAPTVLVISLVLGAATAIAAAWIGRAIASPIEALSVFAEQVSAGQRLSLPQRASGREVLRLTHSIDSMRRKLEGRPFVETFAADLSHELKNPVAAIRASAEVLDEGAIEEPDEARRFVSRIREATQRIERLLNELLSLAKLEARGAERFAIVDLRQLVERCCMGLGNEADRVQLQIDGDVRVRGDQTWLARAVSNLVVNALVHSEPKSSVFVELRRDASIISLSVTSSGEVPKRAREHLFSRFVTTRRDKGGTGLGLAIVRAVAEAHGGAVELVRPGPPDVIFSLSLPPARGAPKAATAEPHPVSI